MAQLLDNSLALRLRSVDLFLSPSIFEFIPSIGFAMHTFFILLMVLIKIYLIGHILHVTFGKSVKMNICEVYFLGICMISYLGFGLLTIGAFQYIDLIVNLASITILLFIAIGKSSETYTISGNENQKLVKIGVFLIIICFAIMLRLPLSNFIFMIGDPGTYTNNANHLAAFGSEINVKLFPLVSIWMGYFCLILDKAYTPLGNLFFSIMTTISFYYLLRAVFDNRNLAFLGFIIISINIMSIWNSRLPYSEVPMLFFNINIIYFYIKFRQELLKLNENRGQAICYIFLFASALGLASLTRITGIVLMGIMSIDFLFNVLVCRYKINYHLFAFNLAFGFYLISVFYGIVYSHDYYIVWIPKQILSLNITASQVIAFHVVWLFSVNVLFYFFRKENRLIRKINSRIEKTDFSSTKNTVIMLVAVGIIISILDFFMVQNLSDLAIVRLLSSIIKGTILKNTNIYYLTTYFSVVSLILFPIGCVILIKKFNLFLRRDLSFLWFFIIVVSGYYLNKKTSYHLYYLYWDRYIYSELFLVYLLLFIAPFVMLSLAQKNENGTTT